MRLAAAALASLVLAAPGASAQWTRYVNPFVGTGGTGHTYPGATAPYGLVQLSPDTRVDTSWESAAGYYFPDSLIYGFSHTHLSGTGITDYGDVMFMPAYDDAGGDTATAPAAVRQAFRHATETARPGFYAVTLDGRPGAPSGIRVRLAATPRVGVQAYTFPRAGSVTVLLDLQHRDELLESRATVSPDRRSIGGTRRSRAWAQNQTIHFHTQLSRPAEAVEVVTGPAGPTHLRLRYRVRAGETITVKTGLSSTGPDGAAANLRAEVPGWDVEAVARATERVWNRELGRIQVTGGTLRQRQNVYTALYHVMIVPNVWTDVDGRYLGRDGRVHTAVTPEGRRHEVYTVYSLWDTFRTAHPLYTLLDPDRARDFARSLLLQYQQAGRLPVWELAANETNTMIGFHAVPVLLDTYAKGVRGFDARLALRAMVDASRTEVAGERAFYDRGYVAAEDAPESVSKTLEFAYDHWAVGEMARLLGDTATAREYARRSLGYRHVFDRVTRLMRPRLNGAWQVPFDPSEVSNHYTEATPWQYAFFAPHDVAGHVALVGGPEAYVAHLDRLFSAPTELRGRHQPDVTGLIGQYAHGNEPSHTTAYLYALAGAPEKTQRLVRTVLDSLYAPTPEGLPGNEDCGQMSAWFVMSALGLFPTTPGLPAYTLTTPLFPRVVVTLARGKRLTIEAPGTGAYTAGLRVNGRPHASVVLDHATVAAGATLRFTRSARPAAWGRTVPADLPRVDDAGFLTAPTVVAGARRSFDSTQTVALASPDEAQIWLTLDGTPPVPYRASRYSGPLPIGTTTTLRALAADGRGNVSAEVQARFVRRPNDHDMTLLSTLRPPYDAGGPRGLTDGLHGTVQWRAGDWHGYQGQDFAAVLDLKAPRPVAAVSAGFLQDTRSWILMPRGLAFETSLDGTTWTPGGRIDNALDPRDYTVQRQTLTARAAPRQARYVRVTAANHGALPVWHLGAGHPAYIFVDEVEVE